MISARTLPAPEALHAAAGAGEKSREHPACFIIRPNSSLSWRGNQVFLAGMTAVTFAIAGGFAWLGFWPMLPFAGLEMSALAFALYGCALRAQRYERLTIDGDVIEVTVGRRRTERSSHLRRAWARVMVEPTAHGGCRLLIRAHGHEVEIGTCLTDEERQRLARAIRRAL